MSLKSKAMRGDLYGILTRMMTSSYGNVSRFIGPLCGESIGLRAVDYPHSGQANGELQYLLRC